MNVKTSKKTKSQFRLVTFWELPTVLKGAAPGSAFEVVADLVNADRVVGAGVSDVELHMYALDETDRIRGVAAWLDDSSADGPHYATPRDIVLWQEMNLPKAEAVKESLSQGVKESDAALKKELDSWSEEGSAMLLRADLQPWADQPRKHFDAEAVEKLAGLMKTRGANPAWPLLVRPHPGGRGFEIADGERRWRAAGIAEIDSLPCVVQQLSDAEMLELAMISSVHKKELSPLETANGFKRMLDERDADGKPLHTVESIASAVSLSVRTVESKLALTRISGTPVGDALDAGQIGEEHARHIASIPGAATRAQVLEMVIRPTGCPAPMPVSELRRRIALDYMKELRGVRWDLDDAELVPVEIERGERVAGGACTGCPWNAASEGKRADRMCMSPDCYRKKETAIHERWVAAQAADGKTALNAAENAKVFAGNGVTLSVTTDYVDLDEKPDKADIGAKEEVAHTWGKLVKDTGVPIVIALDGRGKERALVKRELAVTAIEQLDAQQPAEKQILEPKKKKAAPQEKQKEDALALASAREVEERLARAEHDAIVTAARLPIAKLGKEWFVVIAQSLVTSSMEEQLQPIAARLGWKQEEDWRTSEGCTAIFFERIKTLEIPDIVSLLTELLISSAPYYDIEAELAEALCVDLKKVRKDEQGRIKAEAKGAKTKQKEAALVEWGEEPAEFKWNSAGVCVNPATGTLNLDAKIAASVTVAKCEKGWVYGYGFQMGSTGSSSPAKMNGTHYGERALAERAALLSVKDACEGNDMMAAEKITGYLASAAKGAKA